MRISAVIPVLNESITIQKAVCSSIDSGIDEVIVVDGGSADKTIELARKSGASVLSAPKGRAQQMNFGVERTTGDVIVFLHADCWLDGNVGKQLRECLSNEGVLGGAFRQHIEATGKVYRIIEKGNELRIKFRGIAYGDQAIFMRRKFFNQLGGFPDVPLMEDLLLMKRFCQHSKPMLLPGPVNISPRRWQKYGVLNQTVRNWLLLLAYRLGVKPDKLVPYYPAHE